VSVAPHVDIAIIAALFGPEFLSFQAVAAREKAARDKLNDDINQDIGEKMFDLAKEAWSSRRGGKH
jgi:hypothetical protein